MLEAMGSTPDEMGETLRQVRVPGMRDSTSFMNPVVRYLNRTLDIGGRLEVGAGGSVLRLLLEGRVQEVPLPLPVQAFLDCFTVASIPTWKRPGEAGDGSHQFPGNARWSWLLRAPVRNAAGDPTDARNGKGQTAFGVKL
jgi:hypothetical protein